MTKTKLQSCSPYFNEKDAPSIKFEHCYVIAYQKRKISEPTSHSNCTKCCWCGKNSYYEIDSFFKYNKV